MANREIRKWTREENVKLANQIRTFPQNLHKCFVLVAEDIGRTPGAVANHWYTSLSKDPEYLMFFTASSVHFSRNRKNGMGVSITESIWKKFLRVINNFIGS